MDIGLNTKDYGLHSVRAGGATPAANININDRLFGIPKRLKTCMTGMLTKI